MTISNDTVSVLNELIETCKDGENGFRDASESVKDAELKALFAQYSQQRARFANELESEVRRLGGDAEKSGSVAGSVHRGWLNLKAAITGGDDDAIISECERGEDVAKAAYEKASRTSLPAGINAIVQQQYTQVKEAHDRVRALERAHQA